MAGVSLSTRLIVLLLLLYFSCVLSVTCKACAAQFINAGALSAHLRKDVFRCRRLYYPAGIKRPRPGEDAAEDEVAGGGGGDAGVHAEGAAGGGPQQPGGGVEEGGGGGGGDLGGDGGGDGGRSVAGGEDGSEGDGLGYGGADDRLGSEGGGGSGDDAEGGEVAGSEGDGYGDDGGAGDGGDGGDDVRAGGGGWADVILPAEEHAAALVKTLRRPGMGVNFALYGILSDAGLSGNAYDKLIAWLKDEKNVDRLSDAVKSRKLYFSDAVRGIISSCLVNDGCSEYQHGKNTVAGVKHVEFTLKGAAGASDTLLSACTVDVSYQLRNHLLYPAMNSPPLIDPPSGHVFCSPGSGVDNFANSPAGVEYNDYLQRLWAQREGGGEWGSELHRKVEAQYPGRVHHFVPILAALFGDALAITEGLHASLFQLRIKLGTFHPALAFLSSLCLLAGLCEKPTLGDKATDRGTSHYNDLHAHIWAELGFSHFFDDKFVVLPWEKVAHLGIAGGAGDVVVFKLCLFGLMLDNGEARALFGTQNCLICTALGPTPPLEPVPALAALCARCGSVHRPRAAGLPDGFLVKGAGVALDTKVVRAIDLSAGVYEVAVLQTVGPDTALSANEGSVVFTGGIDGRMLSVSAITAGVLAVGCTVDGEGVLAGTTVAELGAGANGGVGQYVLSVRQTVPDVALEGGFRGSIAGSTLTATVDSHRFKDVLALYGAVRELHLAESRVPGDDVALATVQGELAATKAALSSMGFNSQRSVSAFSPTLVPTAQLPYFSWGGGVAALCGNPLLSAMFEVLHTVLLGLFKMLFSFALLAVSRSRGVAIDGSAKPAGGDAHRLLDGIIRRVRSWTDGVREHRAVWADGISKKGSSFFAGRAYNSLLLPLLACLTPAVLPDGTTRRQLIFLLEHAAWFYTVARNPSSYYGGLPNTALLLGRIATSIDVYLTSTFSGRAFKKGGDDDMHTYKLHQLCMDHLMFFVTTFGTLWDQGAATMESSGGLLKSLYYSTNRHAGDFCLQLGKRFFEGFFLKSVLPHLRAKQLGLPFAQATAPPCDPMLNVNELDTQLAAPPPCAAELDAAWTAFVATTAPPSLLHAGLPTTTAFYKGARIGRRTAWRAVCASDVFDAEVWQLYNLDGNGHHQLHRTRHESTLVPVESAPLVKPVAVFSRSFGGAPPCNFLLARPYKPHTAETERSAEFTICKPRVLDTTYCVVPLCELARCLWALPYYAEAAPLLDAPVPTADKLHAAADTVLVSTYIDFQG